MSYKEMPNGLNLQEQCEYVINHIICAPSKKFQLTENERSFIAEMVMACNQINMIKYLRFERLCNGGFNVWCNCYVGKIKLCKKYTYMQFILKNDNVSYLENKTVEQYIEAIPKWISYIKWCQKDYI